MPSRARLALPTPPRPPPRHSTAPGVRKSQQIGSARHCSRTAVEILRVQGILLLLALPSMSMNNMRGAARGRMSMRPPPPPLPPSGGGGGGVRPRYSVKHCACVHASLQAGLHMHVWCGGWGTEGWGGQAPAGVHDRALGEAPRQRSELGGDRGRAAGLAHELPNELLREAKAVNLHISTPPSQRRALCPLQSLAFDLHTVHTLGSQLQTR